MREVIIIGARGYGREMFHLAKQCKGYDTEFKIKGFLDDHFAALNNYDNYPPIIGPVESYIITPDDVFICALGDVKHKFHYVKLIKNKGGQFMSLIHPSALISSELKDCEGLIVCPYVSISCDVRIGDFVTIQSYSDLGHDVDVGNYCHLNAYAFLGGFVKIGDYTTIHTGAKVLPRLRIGNNSVIGAGSVVIKSVSGNCTVAGNPARVIYYE